MSKHRGHQPGEKITRRSNKLLFEVQKNARGNYDVFRNRRRIATNIPENWLEETLCVRWGICGQDFRDAAPGLFENGKTEWRYFYPD